MVKKFLKKISHNLPVILITGLLMVTSVSAAYKLASTVSSKKNQVLKVAEVTTTDTPSPTTTKSKATPTSSTTVNGMTASVLATHNKAGDCYIAYSGKVYNVSNHSSWIGCKHHGIAGGSDITSRFPHATSYLSSLPIVDNYAGGNGGSNPGIGVDDDDNDEDNDENEVEDEDEDEDEEDDDKGDDGIEIEDESEDD